MAPSYRRPCDSRSGPGAGGPPVSGAQSVAGSTSTRSPRPGGRGVRARRSHSGLVRAGAWRRNRSSPSGDTETLVAPALGTTSASRRQRLGVGRGERARHQRERGERRQRRRTAERHLLGQHRGRFSARDRRQHRVLGHPRLDLHPRPRRPRAAGSDQPGRRGRRAPGCPRSRRAGGPAGAGRCRGRPPRRRGAPGAAPPRCRPGRVPRARGGSVRRPRRGPATSPTSTPSSAASSSRSRLTPARSVFMRSRPQATQTTGRVSPQRGHRSTSSSRGRAAAAPQRAQRASSPQCRQASKRAPPVRL